METTGTPSSVFFKSSPDNLYELLCANEKTF